MTTVHRLLRRLGRGLLFGFSAAIGAWIALLVLTILVTLILRPWR
jgi:hypothetical protein